MRRCQIALQAIFFALVLSVAASAQTFTTLVNFNSDDGAYPTAALVQGRDGNLYGTTRAGGITSCLPPQGCGTIFKMTPAGTLTTIHEFCPPASCADGDVAGSLVLGTDGNFYGIASGGGANSGGTIFKITPRGTFTTLYGFCAQADCADGLEPRSLTLATDGNFYGVTYLGGISTYGPGTIFKITPRGQFTTLHTFDGTDGYYPTSLIQGSDGNFYGTTYGYDVEGSCFSTDCGTLFKMTPSGTLTTLHIFTYTDGSNPYGALVESARGNFSGTTQYGGTVLFVCRFGCGTIFKVTSAGALTTLHYFTWGDGTTPFAGLIWATDANYYGTNSSGGSGGEGTVYEIGSGRLIPQYSFNGENGEAPYAGLLQATSGIFYGSTFGDGVESYGTVFSEDDGLGPFVALVIPSGNVGKEAQILGQGLTGTTSVTFNGVEAKSFTVISDTYMTAVVPSGATTGPVVVTTPSGTLTSNRNFQLLQ